MFLFHSAFVFSLILTASAADDTPNDQIVVNEEASYNSPAFQRNIQAGSSSSFWDKLPTAANAQAKARVPINGGYDTSKTYPGEVSSNAWSYTIMVQEMTHPNAKVTSDLQTVTYIELNAPENVMDRIRFSPQIKLDSWEVCLEFWMPANLQSDASEIDSTCKGVLDTACIDDMKKRLSEDFKKHSETGALGKCPTAASLPASCKSQLSEKDRGITHLDKEDFIGSDNTFDYAVIAGKDDIHKEGNFTAYDKAIRQIYVLGATWGHSSDSADEAPGSSLTCLRVKEFSEGARGFVAATANQGSFSSLSPSGTATFASPAASNTGTTGTGGVSNSNSNSNSNNNDDEDCREHFYQFWMWTKKSCDDVEKERKQQAQNGNGIQSGNGTSTALGLPAREVSFLNVVVTPVVGLALMWSLL